MKVLHEVFSSGKVRGDALLDISVGAIIYQLFSASNNFKKMYVMEFKDANITHFKKWLQKEEGATDWSFVSEKFCHIEGIRDKLQEKEDQVRKAIAGVIKWENFENTPIDTQLVPEVDCVLSLWMLAVISKTKEAFQTNLKKFTSRLKIGGHLLLFLGMNMSFYKMGEHKFFLLSVDETFVRESVTNAGFVIEQVESIPSEINTDLIDYDCLLFILARKES
ncbi:amine N-methyltransferase activity, partial [Pristimantis euphronides]